MRLEPQLHGLPLPAPAERVAVHVALDGPGHEGGALGEALVLGGGARAPFGHRRLDLRAPGREGLDHPPRNAGDLEAPVRVRLLDAVSETRELLRKLVPVHRAQDHLGRVETLVRHGAPFGIFATDHVGDHRVGVEGGVEVA